MNTRKHTKLIHEGNYVAEVDVLLVDSDTGWSPYLSLEDAYKLDAVRDALRSNNLRRASKLSRVFSLVPVSVPISCRGASSRVSR